MLSVLAIIGCCLTLPAEVHSDDAQVTFATIAGMRSGDPRGAVVLGAAAQPGSARRFGRAEIVSRLTAFGFATEDLRVPESVLVHRRSTTVTDHVLTEALKQAASERFADAAVSVANLWTPVLQLAAPPVSVTATLPARVDPAQPFYAKFELQGPQYSRTVFIRAQLRVESLQPLLKRRVAAHTEITAEDVEWRPHPLQGREAPLPQENWAGTLAKKDLEPGTVLTRDQVYVPLFVRKGETVLVRASFGTVSISASMRAKASGRFGETIPVEHLNGSGSATARVTGPGRLEAIPGGR